MLNHCTPCVINALVPLRIPVSYPSPEDTLDPKSIAQKIKANICRFYHVTEEELTGKSRLREIVRPRHVGIYLTHQRLKGKLSLKIIGYMYGGRDHTSVIHAIENITNELQTGSLDPEELQQVMDGKTGPERIIPIERPKNKPRTYSPEDINEMIRLRRKGLTIRQLARKYGISKASATNLTNGAVARKICYPTQLLHTA